MGNSRTRKIELKHRKGQARLKAHRKGPAVRPGAKSRVSPASRASSASK